MNDAPLEAAKDAFDAYADQWQAGRETFSARVQRRPDVRWPPRPPEPAPLASFRRVVAFDSFHRAKRICVRLGEHVIAECTETAASSTDYDHDRDDTRLEGVGAAFQHNVRDGARLFCAAAERAANMRKLAREVEASDDPETLDQAFRKIVERRPEPAKASPPKKQDQRAPRRWASPAPTEAPCV